MVSAAGMVEHLAPWKRNKQNQEVMNINKQKLSVMGTQILNWLNNFRRKIRDRFRWVSDESALATQKRLDAVILLEKVLEKEILAANKRRSDTRLVKVMLTYATAEDGQEDGLLPDDVFQFIEAGKVNREILRDFIKCIKHDLKVRAHKHNTTTLEEKATEVFEDLYNMLFAISNGKPIEISGDKLKVEIE